jgi:hypothetical protein
MATTDWLDIENELKIDNYIQGNEEQGGGFFNEKLSDIPPSKSCSAETGPRPWCGCDDSLGLNTSLMIPLQDIVFV